MLFSPKVELGGSIERLASPTTVTSSSITLNYSLGNCFISTSASLTSTFTITLNNIPTEDSTKQHSIVLIYTQSVIPNTTASALVINTVDSTTRTVAVRYVGATNPTINNSATIRMLTLTIVYAGTTYYALGNLAQYG
jgi:hypothetical protein